MDWLEKKKQMIPLRNVAVINFSLLYRFRLTIQTKNDIEFY